ncbi:MAG: M3 family metallopeptidase [Bryobacteraceae bacterium]
MLPNPLLDFRFEIPFHEIRAEHVEPAFDTLLQDASVRLETAAAPPGEPTYQNTMQAYEAITERLDYALNIVRHLESVATYPELRAAYNLIQPKVSEFYSTIPHHDGLWRAIKTYAESAEAAALTGTRRRFVTKTLDYFRRAGADLDPAGKARLAEIDVELTKLTTKYSENVLDATNAFELLIADEAKLAGLPGSAREAARESAQAKGQEGWRFTLQAPSYNAVLTYLDDASIREQVYRANATRASGDAFDNRPLLPRILELRKEKAGLLGFADFADLVIDDRMAHTGGKAQRFLEELRVLTGSAFHRENEDLIRFRKSVDPSSPDTLNAWDIAYWSEKQRAALYNFDEEVLRPYFPLEPVVAGMFEIFRRLFGIRVIEKTGLPVWDPKVHYFEIHDEESNEFLGGFYADFYPRENKRGGAWMDVFITGVPTAEGAFSPHLGLICGNLNPPSGGKPALLTHNDVETVFHEFGHLLHHCLSHVEVRSLAGTSVAWDFVELPSQILENWCWERESLDLFARHYETGAPIPAELFDNMRRARTYRAANGQMRQLAFGLVDLLLHRVYSERDGDVVEYARRVLEEHSAVPLPPYHSMVTAFTHLFASPVGYGAGYYSYKWAEVLDADAFNRFLEAGIFDRAVGMEFRNKVLARGDSEDPAALYRDFMGRDPDLHPLLVRLGLAA